MGRALLSAAVEVEVGQGDWLPFAHTGFLEKAKVNFKSGKQECPPHRGAMALRWCYLAGTTVILADRTIATRFNPWDSF